MRYWVLSDVLLYGMEFSIREEGRGNMSQLTRVLCAGAGPAEGQLLAMEPRPGGEEGGGALPRETVGHPLTSRKLVLQFLTNFKYSLVETITTK